ncbi:MAG: hypothetical protein R2695_15495 [Acidimicrobiales bacterium]
MIAEGVEQPEQAELLLDLGCRMGAGLAVGPRSPGRSGARPGPCRDGGGRLGDARSRRGFPTLEEPQAAGH